MKNRAGKIILFFAVILLMPLSTVFASEINILQVNISEQTMTVFTDDELRAGGLSCSVSNQSAEIISSGLLSDENALIRTTVLVDISTSMPANARGVVIEMLNAMVANKAGNEEFRLIVFGDEITVLHEFSADRFDLANAVGRINFNGRASRIYEAVFETIPSIARVDSRPTFYRTVVISDGVDNAATGITGAELFHRLQSERYPIDVIRVSSNATGEDRELAAISRTSGGRYFSLNSGTNAVTLADELSIGGFYYIEANIPVGLLDGVERQVDMSDGTNNISAYVRFPVFGAPDAEIVETEEPQTIIETEIPETPESSAAPVVTVLPISEEANAPSENYTPVILIGLASALLVLFMLIFGLTLIRRKRKTRIIESEESDIDEIIRPSESIDMKTEYFADENLSDAKYTIKLSSPNDRSKTWTLDVSGEILIGRAEHCNVKLEERSVAREQCKILIQGAGLAVINLSTTNKTTLNGTNVTAGSALQSGDTLKFGRESLRVDYIQAIGAPPSIPKSPYSNRGKTEPIF
ncbi:MAG: FHA domain-containing protein [Clostridiales bacterium]|jgi:hypothetical protein|nr:FHA domain-containing protein [Clostridiales bacterium]